MINIVTTIQKLIQDGLFQDAMNRTQHLRPEIKQELCQSRMVGHYDGMNVLGFAIVHAQTDLACALIDGLSSEQRVELCETNVGWDMINSSILSEATHMRLVPVVQSLVTDLDENDLDRLRSLRDGRTGDKSLYEWVGSEGYNEVSDILNAISNRPGNQ